MKSAEVKMHSIIKETSSKKNKSELEYLILNLKRLKHYLFSSVKGLLLDDVSGYLRDLDSCIKLLEMQLSLSVGEVELELED